MSLPSDYVLAATLRAIGDGVISCDTNGQVVLINAVAQNLTGWTEGEALGRNLKEVFVIVSEITRRPVEDPVEKVLRLGHIVGMDQHTLLVCRNGKETAIDDSAGPVYDDEGKLHGVVLVFRDVSKRRQAEWNVEMLAESGKALGEARELGSILHRVGSVVSTHFADFCVVDLLQPEGGIRRSVGPHHVAGMQGIADGMVRFYPRPASLHPVTRVLETRESQLLADPGEHVLDQITTSAEHRAYFLEELKLRSMLSVPLLAESELLGVITFVRHRMLTPYDHLDVAAAEELGKRVGLAISYSALREEVRMQRARVEAVMAAVPIGLILAEKSGQIVSSNTEAENIFRHESRYSGSVEQYSEYIAFHEDGRLVAGHEFPLPRAMAEDRVIRNERYLYQRGDGSKGWVSFSAAPVKDETGKVWGGVVAISDIDQLVNAQAAAERSGKRTQTMMDYASVGIAVGTMDGGLSYANSTLLGWIGYSKEEMEAGLVRWDALTPPEYAERDANAIRELHKDCFARPYEKAYIAKDGHRVPLLVGATCIPAKNLDQEKDDIAVFFTDLTLQKRAEQSLLQTEKLTAVGRLASSISHEINNPLEAVTNLLFIVSNSPNLSQSDRDYLAAADRELTRVSRITSQTLRFHRQSTAATEVKPQDLLEEVIALYGTRLNGSQIEVERDFGSTVSFMCFEGDIRQVLSNLVGNAFDAMRTGGRLRLKTRCATWWPTGEPGVRLTVADTGSGMTGDVQKHVFDAFYSTKGIHGTGLGLWISKRIVHKHRGHLRVCSSMGAKHGTVFTLWLPLALAATAGEDWQSEAGGAI